MDTSEATDRPTTLTRRQLAGLASQYGREVAPEAPTLAHGERAYSCVQRTEQFDLWVIHWGAGSGTAVHDHGDSAGALFVVGGELVEHRPPRLRAGRARRSVLRASDRHLMSRTHVHAIVNESLVTATSVHAYSPPLTVMQHYERTSGAGLRGGHRELVAHTRDTSTAVA